MIQTPLIMRGLTSHARRGATKNTFRYAVDFVLLEMEKDDGPALFSRNAANVFSVHDRDHGGKRGAGRGAEWASSVFVNAGMELDDVQILLLTQPRVLGRVFNPVSFWLAVKDAELIAVIAEVNNTFGERHNYLCNRPQFEPIRREDKIMATKVFHVSPFQDVGGHYIFNFSLNSNRVAIRIVLLNSDEGVVTSMIGEFAPMTAYSLLKLFLRRPFAPIRTSALIHWQAMKLFAKDLRYRPRPCPPIDEVS